MKKHYEENWEELRTKIIGFGEKSTRKSYYPELQQRLLELEVVNKRLTKEVEERIKAEEELRESEEKYRTLSNNIMDIIYSLDKMGNILAVNKPAGSRYADEAEMVLGKPFIEIIHPDDREMVVNSFLQAVEDHREYTRGLQFRMQLKDGTVLWMELNSHMRFDEKGNYLQEEGVLRDITERKQAEEEKRNLEERLQRAEKMESLGLLAGGVAHDLNNVLGIVVGYTEMLLMGVNKSSPMRSKLLNVMEGGQKAAAIVQDMLTLARRGVSGRNILNLNKIITDGHKSPEFANLFFRYSAVKIETDLEPDLLNISGSSVHLGKTIFNLLSNAIEAMPKGGLLTIKTANKYLDKPIRGYDEIREGDYVVLSVSDTGEGINKADLKRIFEPFYTKKVMGRSGTGLGLAVVWGTVKDHNGYINVESEEGKGSTFTLYFPVTREELSTEQIAVSVSEYMGKGESILIVDDVKGQRELAEEMLRKLNYSVTSVSSGEEAVAYLKNHKADLMVLDMIMDPGMDGLDTYRSVLEICPEQKAIIVSGFSESDRVKTAQTLGAGAYVKKPYVIEKLGLSVRKELDRAT
jgi:PAS domain S-box-containing protein